uniref:Uncharacterized protein n=1 Tax=Arundo donax TaxID=35708 RepID=A0A0A8YXE6_ARUDO
MRRDSYVGFAKMDK